MLSVSVFGVISVTFPLVSVTHLTLEANAFLLMQRFVSLWRLGQTSVPARVSFRCMEQENLTVVVKSTTMLSTIITPFEVEIGAPVFRLQEG